jgi:hypothetical protein
MDQFIRAMLQQGVPHYAINLVVISEEWQIKFKYFNENELKQMIHFYPTFYKNVIKPLNMVTETELYMLSSQFNAIKFIEQP